MSKNNVDVGSKFVLLRASDEILLNGLDPTCFSAISVQGMINAVSLHPGTHDSNTKCSASVTVSVLSVPERGLQPVTAKVAYRADSRGFHTSAQ